MPRKQVIEKNRVYIECTDANRKVKGKLLEYSDMYIKVELPTGFIMELRKRNRRSAYTFQTGLLEFICDGKRIV